jgi:hypothetical protein
MRVAKAKALVAMRLLLTRGAYAANFAGRRSFGFDALEGLAKN